MVKDEIWKSVSDYPKYEISNMGNVRRNNKQLNLFIVKRYLSFNVVDGEKRRKSMRVHREVAKAFMGDHPNMIVRHLDGNPLNCRLDNLAWGTHKDNERDKKRHGRSLMEGKNHRAKITEEDAIFIRRSKLKAKELSQKFNIGYREAWAIKTGRVWECLEGAV